jgi:hypothetical protein
MGLGPERVLEKSMSSLDGKQLGMVDAILAFEIDDPEAPFPFTARLAREQDWTQAFAARVIEEYKHFIALAMVAGHPVTPSEEVDQAWHLHLIDTRSYWHDLCRDTLGTELHHGPTKGGKAEGGKFFDWYQNTLESYRRIFETEPPADIWPLPEERFRRAGSGVWVDRHKFWLLPKPRLWQRLRKR